MYKPPIVRTINVIKFKVGHAAFDLNATLEILRAAAQKPGAAVFDLAVVERAIADIEAVKEEIRRWSIRLCELG